MENFEQVPPRQRPVKLSVSMVTFNSSYPLLCQTLDALGRAIQYAHERAVDFELQLLLVDNSTDLAYRTRVEKLLKSDARLPAGEIEVWHPGRNVGYGAAHNQALQRVRSDFHLILNPDVELAEDALYCAHNYLQLHSDVVMVSPQATDARGGVQYLCKRYPSVLALSLRAFAPEFIKQWFRKYLYSYEIRENCRDNTAAELCQKCVYGI